MPPVAARRGAFAARSSASGFGDAQGRRYGWRAMPSSTPPERVLWAVDRVAARPRERVLEIGCGPGQAVALLCRAVTRGTVVAIDRSALQVTRAREHNRSALLAGRARIETLSLEDAPDTFGESAFTKVLAINVNVFWTSPAQSLPVLGRLLHPRGAAYLVYEPPSTTALRKLQRELPVLVQEHGLVVEDLQLAAFRASQALCLSARAKR
jgi:SAM-dependent methyltransferase